MFISKLNRYHWLGLLALRLSLGATFLVHGYMKWSSFETQSPLFKFLAVAESLGGMAIILGMLTRWAALGLAVIMIGAIYMKITAMKMGFAAPGWEFDLILLAAAINLIVHGPGKVSVDAKVGWDK
jgi:putative oxidoreductase